jgi:hypothetical protein
MIAPFFESLADKYPTLMFVKVDVDTCQARRWADGPVGARADATACPAQGVAAECGIQAMPTFQARLFRGCPTEP